jgi:hypothetical protein
MLVRVHAAQASRISPVLKILSVASTNLSNARFCRMTSSLVRDESLEPADERASFLAQGGCRSISDDLTIPYAGVLAYTLNAALRLRASP